MRSVAVIGGGIVGCAVALELARRGLAVELLEAEPALALGASGTNSGIIHTGFDSVPGELETALILRSAELRPAVLEALEIPHRRCGAELHAPEEVIERYVENAARNGVIVERFAEGLLIAGESITDPVVFTLALAAEAQRHGATVRCGVRVDDPAALEADVVVACLGIGAAGVYPRKGEFVVHAGPAPERIRLPAPSERGKGILTFPTLDGMVVTGPTAVDLEAPDWTVSDEAVAALALPGREVVFAYAGLRPAGRGGANYVFRREGPVLNVEAIRSTGLTASLGIAEHVAGLLGVDRDPAPLIGGPAPVLDGPWWRRAAEHRA